LSLARCATREQSCSKLSTSGKANDLHCLKQPVGDLRPRLNKGWQALSEDFARAVPVATEKLADREMKNDLATSTRDISQRPLIPTMDL
jgi:hypothetical protein